MNQTKPKKPHQTNHHKPP